MDFVIGLIQAAVTLGAIALIIVALAFLILLVFSLTTVFDKRTNNQ